MSDELKVLDKKTGIIHPTHDGKIAEVKINAVGKPTFIGVYFPMLPSEDGDIEWGGYTIEDGDLEFAYPYPLNWRSPSELPEEASSPDPTIQEWCKLACICVIKDVENNNMVITGLYYDGEIHTVTGKWYSFSKITAWIPESELLETIKQ